MQFLTPIPFASVYCCYTGSVVRCLHKTDMSFPPNQTAGAQAPWQVLGMPREGDWGREALVMVAS